MYSRNFKDNCSKSNVATRGKSSIDYVVATEQSPGNQTRNESAPSLSCSNKYPTDILEPEQRTTTTISGLTTNPSLTITTPLIEEGLVRDEQIIELHLPLTFTEVLKRKQERLYVPLDFEKNLTVNALVDSRAYISAIIHNELETLKQTAPIKFLKLDNLPNFQIQVANG